MIEIWDDYQFSASSNWRMQGVCLDLPLSNHAKYEGDMDSTPGYSFNILCAVDFGVLLTLAISLDDAVPSAFCDCNQAAFSSTS